MTTSNYPRTDPAGDAALREVRRLKIFVALLTIFVIGLTAFAVVSNRQIVQLAEMIIEDRTIARDRK
jgi:hypothetical protein